MGILSGIANKRELSIRVLKKFVAEMTEMHLSIEENKDSKFSKEGNAMFFMIMDMQKSIKILEESNKTNP